MLRSATLLIVTVLTLAGATLANSGELAAAQQIQYGVAYSDKDCSKDERRIYGLNNVIQVDHSELTRGIKGLRPLTIYSDDKCTQNGKYYRMGHCAHYDSDIVSIFCAHMN